MMLKSAGQKNPALAHIWSDYFRGKLGIGKEKDSQINLASE